LLNLVRELFFQTGPVETSSLTGEPKLLVGRIQVTETKPIHLDLGERGLHLYPDHRMNGDWTRTKDWFLVDSKAYTRNVSAIMRIACGDKVALGRGEEAVQRIFHFSKGVRRRHLEIANADGQISISRLDDSAETYVHYVEDVEEIARPLACRLASLKAIRHIFGGKISLLTPDRALAVLKEVNTLLENEAYRQLDSFGRPGGLLDLPGGATQIVVGDLHANLDNFLKVLSENACLDALRRGEANLVVLGDALHSQQDGELDEMDSSLLMLDLILSLKRAFPHNFFYIRGNHDSFDESICKAGVPQGLLLKKKARQLRGVVYAEELAKFFDLLPYVVRSEQFVACHGGPPCSEFVPSDLVNIRSKNRLAQEIVWNRIRRHNRPIGYARRHVEALRAKLGVDQKIPLVVGHSPQSEQETLWLNAGGIPNHHIVYSANPHNLAVFIGLNGDCFPLEYHAEPLLDLINSLKI